MNPQPPFGRILILVFTLLLVLLYQPVHAEYGDVVLNKRAEKEGMRPLRKYGFDKVAAGVTTIEEVMRVTTSDLNALDE